ncbi:hypothetical protein D1AOALGA4SA_402 [Olavius algarvensis Delta 1 endosymbiont]|nr:hypothetical protein D1AOALGA4SA_402 [Olavius algarvensis Delta 1 endosymbiont]
MPPSFTAFKLPGFIASKPPGLPISAINYELSTIEPAHKLKIDQNKLQNCRSNILNLVNVL